MLCNSESFQTQDPHARWCIFIGYPPNHKGYKLYDLEDNTGFVSKDVVFHESIFPFHETTSASHFYVLPNLVFDLDRQNSTFPTTQSTSPTSPSEPITEPIPPIELILPIDLIPKPMTIESPMPNSSLDISTQPLLHSTCVKHSLA